MPRDDACIFTCNAAASGAARRHTVIVSLQDVYTMVCETSTGHHIHRSSNGSSVEDGSACGDMLD